MATIFDWTAVCVRRDRGRLFLDNLAIDIDGAHLAPSHVSHFRSALIEALNSAAARTTSGHSDHFADIGAQAISDSTLYLQGKTVSLPEEDLAFVFRLDNFIADIWYDFTDAGGYDQLSGPESILDLLNGIADKTALVRPSAALRGGLPMVWLTSFSDLIVEIDKQPCKADAARDALGLINYSSDCYLCYIRISPGDLDWTALRRPNAFDGGLNLVFRSNQATEPTGRTVDLVHCRPQMREIVTTPVPLRGYHRPFPLGRLSSSAGFSWAQLCSALVEARIARVARFLEGLKNE